ncbi:hypothetical protein HYY74_03915 [Candidatus Woesearchaeota archaeon]|nr:hypothetical protein [Candidatus Woesearchaeota archaeon]
MNFASSIDLLAYPGYEISGTSISDEPTRRNVSLLRDAWLESIDAVAQDPTRYLALVTKSYPPHSCPDLPPEFAEFMNPHRTLHAEVLEHALGLGSRLLLFNPTVSGIRVFNWKGPFRIAEAAGTLFAYVRERLIVKGYGEHTGIVHKGCLDRSLDDLASGLGVPKKNVSVDYARSLPIMYSVKNEKDFHVPDEKYLTVDKIVSLGGNP